MTLNFYFNTKTLQVQAKASSEVKNKLHDIFNSRNRPVQDNGREGDEGGSEENVDFLNSDERNFTLSEMSNTFSVVSPDEQEDSLPRTHTEVLPVSCVCKIEIAKLWNAIDKLNSQLLPQEKQELIEQELNRYRVKCVLYEDKIKKLEEEKANLLEALRILSTESNFHSQVAPERVDDFHLSTKKTIASNQGADEGQLAPSKTKETMVSNQPKRAVHGQQAKIRSPYRALVLRLGVNRTSHRYLKQLLLSTLLTNLWMLKESLSPLFVAIALSKTSVDGSCPEQQIKLSSSLLPELRHLIWKII